MNGATELVFHVLTNQCEERVSVWFSVENPRLFLFQEGLVFKKRETRTASEKKLMTTTDL
jgi:hypothetical protein